MLIFCRPINDNKNDKINVERAIKRSHFPTLLPGEWLSVAILEPVFHQLRFKIINNNNYIFNMAIPISPNLWARTDLDIKCFIHNLQSEYSTITKNLKNRSFFLLPWWTGNHFYLCAYSTVNKKFLILDSLVPGAEKVTPTDRVRAVLWLDFLMHLLDLPNYER